MTNTEQVIEATDDELTLEESLKLAETRAEYFLRENEVPDEIFIYENLDLLTLFAKAEKVGNARTIARLESSNALLSRKVEVLETGGHEVLKTAIRAQRERDELKAEVEKQKAVNEVLREGLEYYSEPLNWVCAECVYKSHHGSDHPNGNRNEYLLRGTGDNGHTIAQRALEAVRDEKGEVK